MSAAAPRPPVTASAATVSRYDAPLTGSHPVGIPGPRGNCMNKLALLALACAGCATAGNVFQDSDPKSPARQRVEAALPAAAEKALTTPTQVPSRQMLGRSGRTGILEKVAFSEENFRYSFRLVKDADDTHQSPDKSWALPAGEYPRVIHSVYTDVWAAAEAGGGKVVDSRCDGSTFLIRYESSVRGRPATGTVRGWVGPEDPNGHKPPPTEPYYSVISVDVREEAERKW